MISALVSPQVVCTLKEFNEYRQYLTTLKLEAENTFRREEVGNADCSRTPVSGKVPRAGALRAASRGGGQRRRGEGCAGGPGVVALQGLPGSELS